MLSSPLTKLVKIAWSLLVLMLLFAVPASAAFAFRFSGDGSPDLSDESWGPESIGGYLATITFNGHYYELVEVIEPGVTWSEAKDAAAAMEHNGIPGHLATITSEQEEDFLVSSFPEIYPEYVWLGASDEVSEGDWEWITGETWDYTDWAAGEPNGGTSENCLDFGDFSAQWNDESCRRPLHFYLVEYSPEEPPPAVPEASTLLLLGSAATGLAGYVGLQIRARRRR